MSTAIKKSPCPKCRENGNDKSGDNLITFPDGGSKCFACNFYSGNGTTATYDIDIKTVQFLPHSALRERGISAETAEHFGVRVEYNENNGQDKAYYYPVTKRGETVGYQVRVLPKFFKRVGDTKGCELFGASLYSGGKMVIVCEGQDDVLACYELLSKLDKKYRVVGSLGTTHWKSNLEYLERFDNVIVMFDQDAPGKQAAEELAAAMTPGKVKLAKWDADLGKDVNDLLLNDEYDPKDFLKAIFDSTPYEPSGILTGEAVWSRIENYTKPDFVSYPPEWTELNEKAEGLRRGEISIWCAGSSIGKTSFIRRIKQHVLTGTNWKIGEVELEERPEKTFRGMMEFQAGKPMYEMTAEEKRAAYLATYGTERIFTLDHRSQFSRGSDLMSKFKYLHYAKGVDLIALDHVTLGVREFGKDGNESVDQMMEEFLRFVETTGVHLLLISHLRKSPGGNKSWSRGAIPDEESMKGSGSLYQIAFDVIGVSRNKMHPDEYSRNVSTLHVSKCRETGNTGQADMLYWDNENRTLQPADPDLIRDEDECIDEALSEDE